MPRLPSIVGSSRRSSSCSPASRPAATARRPLERRARLSVRRGAPQPGQSRRRLQGAFQRFQEDQMTDRAAALTYYSLLSLFPALLFGVAVLGVLRPAGADQRRRRLPAGRRRAAGRRSTRSPGARVGAAQRGTAVGALVIGLVTSLIRRLGRVRRGRARAQRDLAGRGGPRLRQAQGARPRVDAARARARAGHVRAGLPRRRRSPPTCSARSGSATRAATSG